MTLSFPTLISKLKAPECACSSKPTAAGFPTSIIKSVLLAPILSKPLCGVDVNGFPDASDLVRITSISHPSPSFPPLKSARPPSPCRKNLIIGAILSIAFCKYPDISSLECFKAVRISIRCRRSSTSMIGFRVICPPSPRI